MVGYIHISSRSTSGGRSTNIKRNFIGNGRSSGTGLTQEIYNGTGGNHPIIDNKPTTILHRLQLSSGIQMLW